MAMLLGAPWPIFDSLGVVRSVGFLLYKDLRSHRGAWRENVVPEYALQVSDYVFFFLTSV